MTDPQREHRSWRTRRYFFSRASTGIGVAALASLLGDDLGADPVDAQAVGGLAGLPHFAPKAKRVIYLFMSGGPSQMDLLDYKPRLKEFQGTDLPDSIRKGQRLTGMTAAQGNFPVASSIFQFQQHGRSGAWVSELLPHTAKNVETLTHPPFDLSPWPNAPSK